MKKKLNCILLIDDDEPTNLLNTILLEDADCTEHIEALQGGQLALDYLVNRRQTMNTGGSYQGPDLIFLDINMPAMNGWEFLDKYNELDEELRSKIVIVMLTTSLNPDDRQRAGKISAIADFETKPITQEKLDNILQKHFADHFSL